MMRTATVLSLLMCTLAIVFAVINPLAVDINFGLFTIKGASLPLVLITTLLLGVLIGYLAWLPMRISARRHIRTLERGLTSSLATDPEIETNTLETDSMETDPDRG